MAAVVYEGNDLEVLADMPNYYSWIMETFSPHVRGSVVEYGAGVGSVSARLEPLATTLTLVEPSANLTDQLRTRFALVPKVEVVGASLETHVEHIEPGTIDTMVLVNVLEHVEDDRKALASMIAALRTGGHLLVFVPAMQFLMSRLDRSLGHFRRYHKTDLVAKVRDAGGVIERCHYFDLPGILPWFVLNKLLGSMTFNPKLLEINDRYVVPISRGIERIVSPPLGKNLILVASKR
jgi:SAM-dependent methyltransferase